MSYVINKLAPVKPARKPIEDGEYSVIISRFEEPINSNPYFVFTLEDKRERRYYINSDKGLEMLQEQLNEQLEIDVDDTTTFDSWKDMLLGRECMIWVLTNLVTDEDGTIHDYSNTYLRKPTLFDAKMNGLLENA